MWDRACFACNGEGKKLYEDAAKKEAESKDKADEKPAEDKVKEGEVVEE